MFKKLLLSAAVFVSSIATSNVAFATGDADAGKAKSVVCAACHGAQGISLISVNPNLAGQVPGYIAAQLAVFKSGERANAIMAGQAAGLSNEDMADLDAYYASLVPNVEVKLTEQDKELAEAGGKIYRGGFADRGIAACMACHGPSGHGIPKNYPRVSAQHKEYLEQSLLAYKKGERKGYNDIMNSIAFGLSELQIKQLSAYIAGLN
ncbi:MAG: cytochrome c4 [Arenicella sp.]|nr:cytochrome c4 [Arenicella sp.]